MTTLQSRAASAYATVSLDSRASAAGGADLVILLIEGILDRIRLAKLAMQQRDIQTKLRHLNKALEIMTEGLRAHLNIKSGGEIAANLDDLYGYCSVRLLQANLRNDASALDEVSDLLVPLLDAWNSIRNGTPSSSAVEALVEVTRALRSSVPSVPSVQRMYGASAYAGYSSLRA